jgi:hypothetical protein
VCFLSSWYYNSVSSFALFVSKECEEVKSAFTRLSTVIIKCSVKGEKNKKRSWLAIGVGWTICIKI